MESDVNPERKPDAQRPERLDLMRSISADNVDKIAKEEPEVVLLVIITAHRASRW